MRLAADAEDDRPANDTDVESEGFTALDVISTMQKWMRYLGLMVGSRRRDLVIILVGNSDALKGSLKIGDVHNAGELHCTGQ